MDIVPHGPRKIGAKYQIVVGAELFASIGSTLGDKVWVALNPDRPGTLIVIPQNTMMEVFRKGWTAAS